MHINTYVYNNVTGLICACTIQPTSMESSATTRTNPYVLHRPLFQFSCLFLFFIFWKLTVFSAYALLQNSNQDSNTNIQSNENETREESKKVVCE